jgi:uncharacterized protein DUF5916
MGLRIATPLVVLVMVVSSARGFAQPPEVSVSSAIPPTLHIKRASSPITVDGVLDDAGWKDVPSIEEWYETNPGDNTVPKVQTHGRMTYDDDALYVGLEFDDPDPSAIRAPVADHDKVTRDTDYGGVIIDATDSRRTAVLFLVNPRGVQYDSVSDDANGEDASPDFFWDSATRITDKGWTLEIRIPFSSLSYARRDPQHFRIMLYRNYPRDFRYQIFTTQLPHDSTCFICRASPLIGLAGLPEGGGLVVAPYVSGAYVGKPPLNNPGGRLSYGTPDLAAGFDAKWRPTAGTVIDATVNPDFSQIESDVALITANERFALSYPEKRPFFLEGIELLSTPITAVSTRSLTDPAWGARSTVKLDHLAFTALAVQDEGGGSVILPGATSSGSADQQFRSWAGIARLRYALGSGYLGALATTREIEGGGFNRLGGLDLQLHPFDSDSLTGQYLYSVTRTPDRMELTPQWDGRWLAGHAALLRWVHTGSLFDFTTTYRDLGSEFRADDGFVPQVGIREGYAEAGLTFRLTQGPLRRLHAFTTYDRVDNPSFDLVSQQATAGVDADALLGSTLQINYQYDQILVNGKLLPRNEVAYIVSVNPGALVSRIDLSGSAGQQIDFENARTGTGFDAALGVTARPTPHLELQLNESLRWLDVDVAGQTRTRLFTARVDRLRATYSFTARMFVRLTGQYEVTQRSRELYLDPMVARKAADFTGSLLFAYKINWQSVLFVGYGDNRTFSETTNQLDVSGRQVFVKVSHAFQW